jgi:hypothetical protein
MLCNEGNRSWPSRDPFSGEGTLSWAILLDHQRVSADTERKHPGSYNTAVTRPHLYRYSWPAQVQVDRSPGAIDAQRHIDREPVLYGGRGLLAKPLDFPRPRL